MATLARDVMTKAVITVRPSTPLRDVAHTFAEDRISGAPVVDESDRLVGIVSRTDVISGLLEAGPESVPLEMRLMLGIGESDELEPEEGGDVPAPDVPVGPTVEDVMDGDPVTVAPDTPLHEIAERMATDRIHRVVVTDRERIVGILTSLDLLGRFPVPAARPEARPAAKAKPARRAAKAPAKAPAKKPVRRRR